MARYFNEQEWQSEIAHHDWYLRLFPLYQQLAHIPEAAEELYAFFEQKLAAGEIALGADGPDWDRERKSIDTIVVHHTHCPPGITLERLSAMHLLRLYAANYGSPAPSDYHAQGDPIFSNHFWGGKQVFYAYHWLIRMDGTTERLLKYHEIGWHAGNWEVNCRSIGIVLDNNFEESIPPGVALDGLTRVIREQYRQVSHERILGHREVNRKTTCPGNNFLGGWKQKLLARLS